MLTPLSWLKDYVDIDVTPKELEEKLFSCGFEVEESYEVGKDISNVVVGLVIAHHRVAIEGKVPLAVVLGVRQMVYWLFLEKF